MVKLIICFCFIGGSYKIVYGQLTDNYIRIDTTKTILTDSSRVFFITLTNLTDSTLILPDFGQKGIKKNIFNSGRRYLIIYNYNSNDSICINLKKDWNDYYNGGTTILNHPLRIPIKKIHPHKKQRIKIEVPCSSLFTIVIPIAIPNIKQKGKYIHYYLFDRKSTLHLSGLSCLK